MRAAAPASQPNVPGHTESDAMAAGRRRYIKINEFVNSDGQWLLSFYKIETDLLTTIKSSYLHFIIDWQGPTAARMQSSA